MARNKCETITYCCGYNNNNKKVSGLSVPWFMIDLVKFIVVVIIVVAERFGQWKMYHVFFLFYYFVFGFSINIYVYKNASLFVFRCGVGFDGLIGNSFLGIILLLVSFDSLKRFGLLRIKRLEPHRAYNIPIDCINKSCHDLGFNRILNVFFCLSQQRT